MPDDLTWFFGWGRAGGERDGSAGGPGEGQEGQRGERAREHSGLDRRTRCLLAAELGIPNQYLPPTPPDEVTLRPSALPEPARRELAGVVGDAYVRTDRVSRLLHTGGKSYLDLLRRRHGDAEHAPDAVVLPAEHDEVLAVLAACTRRGIAVVPFGGGTSVVGGVEPERGPFEAVVAVDLSRLVDVVVDPRSLVARLGAGLRGPDAEARLAEYGFTLGHFPQSFARASIGGYAATRSAGQASSGYGRFDELVLALRVATPAGSVEAGRLPSSAAGPDLRQLFLGSEGTLGVITEVTARVRRQPEVRRYEAWSFPSFASGLEALRRLAQEGALPDVTRLSDAEETRVNLALAGGAGGLLRRYQALRGHAEGCVLVVGWEDSFRRVALRRAEAVRALRDGRGLPLGRRAGDAWARGRFAGPYLRDDLLDAGALVETLETAASWAEVATLRERLAATLRGALEQPGPPARAPLVMCHVSHVYPSGASLYFTVVAARLADLPDAVAQWTRAKRAAGDAIVAARATITHHHAVGLEHRPWVAAEVGPLGVDVLRAVKDRLDPTGILNPGKLIPPGEPGLRSGP